MATRIKRLSELSVEDLRNLIAQEVKRQLETPHPTHSGDQPDSRSLSAARQYIEEHRFSLPPDSPSVVELVRQERDRWQP
jgi:hypothetical protein